MTEQELLESYQKKVSMIPECRYLIQYHEELAVEILPFLINNYNKNSSTKDLVLPCLKRLRGHANPMTLVELIEEWKATE